jgi:protein-L-isoaspartate O-methyltransferase
MQDHEYKFALRRELNVSAEELRTLWNSTAECSDVAVADVERTRGGILGIETMNEALVVLGNIATGVASSALYDLIVRILAARGKQVALQKQVSADGDFVVVISEVESGTA